MTANMQCSCVIVRGMTHVLYKLVKFDVICPLTEGEMIYILGLCVTGASV